MAGNLNVPASLTKIVEIKYTDDALRRYLTEVANTLKGLQEQITALEARVTELEP